ncbi:hypothetical protein BDB01DRAFT_285079 [Pilobolus umbonatus]|nr:hypothetical protein BDB01DRAFT_285079 [Pilobolus umbonatus]
MVIVACVIHIGSLMMMIVKLQQWKRIRLLLIGSFNIMIISITVVMRGQYDLFHQNVYFNTTSILVLVLLVGWLPTTFSFPATHNVTPMPPFILRKTTETLPIYSKLTPPPPYKESSSYLHQHQPIRISPLPTIV